MDGKNLMPSSKEFLKNLLGQKEVLKIIVGSVAETIISYTKIPVVAGKPYFKDQINKSNIAIAGLIRFESNELKMELFLGFSKELFLTLYESIFSFPSEEISSENHDLAGEVLNISFGIMDPKFKKIGYKMRSSLPKFYSGESLKKLLDQIQAQAVVIPFSAADKNLFIELYSADSLNEQWEFTSTGNGDEEI